ncbi:MAG: MarR family transcriptional regulator [Alphaproteobacteria bacterium]|nr:MarR family transcriptional regulator [Alphaproteobacteria bacterium]
MPKPLSRDKLPKSAEELICFNIYSAGHAFNRAYSPMLKKLKLTYPQYITLTILWETDGLKVGDLCEKLRLESSTLTPLLKRLEALGYIKRQRGKEDERQVFVHLTKVGSSLQKHAGDITRCIIEATGYDLDTLDTLVKTIAELRDNVILTNSDA